MSATVISLAAVRASLAERAEERAANLAHCIEIAQPVAKALNFGSYTAPPPAAPTAPAASKGPASQRPAIASNKPAAPLAPRRKALIWRQSQRGNWWTKDAGSGTHVVLYETSRGWSGRATPRGGEGFHHGPLEVRAAPATGFRRWNVSRRRAVRKLSPSAELVVDPGRGARGAIRDTGAAGSDRYHWTVTVLGEPDPMASERTGEIGEARRAIG